MILTIVFLHWVTAFNIYLGIAWLFSLLTTNFLHRSGQFVSFYALVRIPSCYFISSVLQHQNVSSARASLLFIPFPVKKRLNTLFPASFFSTEFAGARLFGHLVL
jgi:hypothetical protein